MATYSELLEQMRTALQFRNFNLNTEKAYLYWARAYLLYNDNRDPVELGRAELEAFLSHLAVDRYAASSTQNQALKAIQFLYEEVMDQRPEWLSRFISRRAESDTPNILSPQEVQRLLSRLHGQDWLIACLVYGAGLRLMESLRLRIRDLNINEREITVRDPEGHVIRETILPKHLIEKLRSHLDDRKMLHIKDIAEGMGEAYLPPGIAESHPGVARSWGWQYLFPEQLNRTDPESLGVSRRHHVHEVRIRQAIERAAIEANIFKRVSADTLRNSFGVHLIQRGVPLRDVEALLGTRSSHDDDSQPVNPELLRTPSPLDRAVA